MLDFGSVWITIKLAVASTVLLLIIAIPVALWLSTTKSRFRPFIEALTALPLVLPPTVLGFYLLILFNPNTAIGSLWIKLTGDTLTFSFTGILVAAVLHSLPFAVQPLLTSFESIGKRPSEVAMSLGATPFDAFLTVIAPLASRGLITASVLGFAHTMGEFGVILMVGGNIPNRTRVISIDIFTSVETMDYTRAHILSLGMFTFSFMVLLSVYILNRRHSFRV